MRKSVKLVASALAAVAVVGGSATAASADSKPIDGKNVCGNDTGQPVASARDNGETTIDDVLLAGQTTQVICQVGEHNHAVTYNEGDVIGGDFVYAVGTVLDDLTPNVAVTS
jgi:hypothetical protein